MFFGLSDEHVRYHIHNVHDQVARTRSARPDTGGQSQRQGYLPRLRSRVGFTLVEAGLHLLRPEGPTLR